MLSIPSRFYSLDILRGVAALSVVFAHWNHLFYKGTSSGLSNAASQPLYRFFFMFYEMGWHAVNLFFVLSGFIFFMLYSKKISDGGINVWDFCVLRFSRLYPLHFITLLAVLVGQQFVYYRTEDFFVYPMNDLYHLMLNIFFASAWGFEKGLSFNAPVWSVSIEILLYALFYIICLKLPRSFPVLLSFSLLGFVFMLFFSSMLFFSYIGRGLFFFFIGGLVYLFYLNIIKKNLIRMWEKRLIIFTLVGWTLVVIGLKYNLSGLALLNFGILIKSVLFLFYGGVFAITILSLAIVETRKGRFGQKVSFIGDISYSSYLLHFPLQLFFIIIISYVGISTSFFYTSFSLLLFFVVLIIISLISYQYFERPIQKALRDRLMKG